MAVFCNSCDKDFNFNDLPTNRPIFCPDCGRPAIIMKVNASETLQRRKNGSNVEVRGTLEPSTAIKNEQTDPLRTERIKTYSLPRYNHRIALVLTSLGVIGLIGIGQIYTKYRKGVIRGICFLIGGFFVYLLVIAYLDYIVHPTSEYPEPEYGFVFFLIIYILIWLWQFIDLRRLLKYSV